MTSRILESAYAIRHRVACVSAAMPRICWSGAEHSAMLVAGLLLLSIGVFGSFLSKFHSQMLGTVFQPCQATPILRNHPRLGSVSFCSGTPRLCSVVHLCCSESAPVERYGEASPRAILPLPGHWPLNASPVSFLFYSPLKDSIDIAFSWTG